MRYLQNLLILSLFVVLTSCAYVKKSAHYSDRDVAYLSATSTPPLHIPPGLTSQGIENYYPVSEKNYTQEEKVVSIVPPNLPKAD